MKTNHNEMKVTRILWNSFGNEDIITTTTVHGIRQHFVYNGMWCCIFEAENRKTYNMYYSASRGILCRELKGEKFINESIDYAKQWKQNHDMSMPKERVTE